MNDFKPIKQEKTVISIRLDIDMLKKLMNYQMNLILVEMNWLFNVLTMLLKIINVMIKKNFIKTLF